MAARRKAEARQAPATIEEATALAARYAELNSMLELEEAEADAAIAQIRAMRDERLVPLQTELREIFEQLRTWWPTARETMTGGRRRSAELAGVELGERRAPPALKLPRGWTIADALTWARGLRNGGKYLRVKHELNKEALVEDLRSASDAQALIAIGFRAEGADEFYITVRPGTAEPTGTLP